MTTAASTALATRARAWARAQRTLFLDRLAGLAAIETPSGVPEAHGPALELLERWLREEGFDPVREPGRRTAGCLRAGGGSGPRQLLVGHLDTVWPIGTIRERPVRVEGDVVHGPGVLDMKAGLVMAVLALRCLRELGAAPAVSPELLITTDEEIASPESTPIVRARAQGADRALVLEPAHGPEGALKTRRKGSGRFEIRVTGVAAHAGLEPEKGASATVELAHQILAVAALHDPARGVSVNVGTIEGGVATNVVAPHALARLDVRVPDAAAAARVRSALDALAPVTPGTRVKVTGSFHRPPMEASPAARRLFRTAQALGAQLGLDLDEVAVGGASDGNTTSQFAPTLDGLGPVGEGAHAVTEHVRVEATLDRVALLALLLLEPPVA